MKAFISFILLFFSLLSFSQEPIYNINENNVHLINFASSQYSDYIRFDNSFEFYNENKTVNFTNLLVNIPVFGWLIKPTVNIKNEYLNADNIKTEVDAVFVYNFILGKKSNLQVATNLGYIKADVSYKNIFGKYSYKINTPIAQKYTMQSFNLGFSTILCSNIGQIGLSINHLNKPNIPTDDNERLPIKYSAFISRNLYKNKLFANIIYQYQEGYFYNHLDADYYNMLLNYLGFGLNYYQKQGLSFGVGMKYLSNDNIIASIQAGYHFGKFDLNYSFSNLTDDATGNNAQFHQIGLYYKFVSRLSGSFSTMHCVHY